MMAPTKRKSGQFPAGRGNKTPEVKRMRRAAPADDAGSGDAPSRVTRSRNKPAADGADSALKLEKKGTPKIRASPKEKAKPEPKDEVGKSQISNRKTPKAPKAPKAPEAPPQAPKTGSHNSTGGDKACDRPYYWLMKAEPEPRLEKGIDVSFSIDDLEKATEPEPWDGVRNYVARNNMRAMAKGELAFLYHSNCKTPGVAGIMQIVREASVDENAHNPSHPYYDPKSTPENPRWSLVHVEFIERFPRLVTLVELKQLGAAGGPLENMQMLKQTRLSVSKVSKEGWEAICRLGRMVKDGKEKKV